MFRCCLLDHHINVMQNDAVSEEVFMGRKHSVTNPKKRPVRTTVSVPKDDYEELERISSDKKVSVAWVVREAIERYLEQQSRLPSSKPK